MALVGSLNTMSLTDLVQWIGSAQKTGTLEVERSKVTKRVIFREGRVTACSSDVPSDFLGHYLVSRGSITEQVLRQALALQETSGGHLGSILVGMAAISKAELEEHLAAKAEETIYSLFDWQDAEFRFQDDTRPSQNLFPISLPVEDILLRGLQRYDELRHIRSVFNDPGIVLKRTEREPSPNVFSNRMARGIYASVNGERTVAEILLHAHSSEYLVTKFLFELFRNGLVQLHEVRHVAADPGEAAGTPPRLTPPVDASVRPALARPPGGPPVAPRPAIQAKPAVTATGSIGRESPAIARAPAPETDLEAARRLMTQGDYDLAIDILNGAYRSSPGDEPLRRLIAEAEVAFIEKAYRHYLPSSKIPVLTRPAEQLTLETLSPAEFFLLSRIDGVWDIKSIIQITPIREVDTLRTLKRMREKGFIELRDPA